MSLHLASIHVYPVKSLGGFATDTAQLTDRGLQHDRRWMLVDEQGKFLSQRELAAMACLHCSPADEGFRVHDLRDGASLQLPWSIAEGEKQRAQLWSATLPLLHGDPAWDAWFTTQLERPVRLVYMPDASKRRTDGRYASYHQMNGFVFTNVLERGQTKARFRLRGNPGFHLLKETMTYENTQRKTYHIEIERINDRLSYSIDGNRVIDYIIERERFDPSSKGLFGFRTWHTTIWWDNLKIVQIE